MGYHKKILEQIRKPENWPVRYENSEHLNELHSLAEEAFESNTKLSYISSILIYQQLTEESLRCLLRHINFFIQLACFPVEINFAESKKRMFGRIVDELKSTIEFDNKPLIIKEANRLNENRIAVVHGLTKIDNLEDLREHAVEVRTIFSGLFREIHDSLDWLDACFKDFMKDSFNPEDGFWTEYE